MSGLTLSEIRAAIGTQLRDNIDRQTNIDVDSEGKPAPVLRLFLQQSDPIDYWGTFGSTGIAEARFDLVIDPGNVDQSAVIRLDEYLSVGTGNTSSVIDALMEDVTLGGAVQTCRINSSQYDQENVTATLSLTVVCRKQGANA